MKFIRRFFSALLNGLDVTRRLLLNLVFLGVIIFVVVSFSRSLNVQLSDNFVLAVDIWGDVVDEYQGDPLQLAISRANGEYPAQTRLRDLVDAIDHAASDSRVLGLELRMDYLGYISPAQTADLVYAIQNFKNTHKPVYAVGQSYSQEAYRLAAEADEIWLDPIGGVFIDGYENYRNYFKEGLEKLSVDINVFRVGKYKSAVEPFLRSDMSNEAKEASLAWLSSLWLEYRTGLELARSIPAERIEAYVNDYAILLDAAQGDTATVALASGLVDSVATADEFDQAMNTKWAAHLDAEGLYPLADHRQYLSNKRIEATLSQSPDRSTVGVIHIQGTLSDFSVGDGFVQSWAVAEQVEQAIADPKMKAVVLRINSPGGVVSTAELIRRQVLRLQESGKPVVVSMGSVAASGGYWIAADADAIWAQPSTITGSIGIFGMVHTLQNSMARLGVYTDGIGTSQNAGAWRSDVALSDSTKTIFQATLDKGYQDFIGLVANGRSMSLDEADAVGQGRVWSGADAKEHGLVDSLGGLNEAAENAAVLAGLNTPWELQVIQAVRSPLEQFFYESAFAAVGESRPLSDSLLRAVGAVAARFEIPELPLVASLRSQFGNSVNAQMLRQSISHQPASPLQAAFAVCACDAVR